MRTGVLADPIMLNILDQEIASRGPAVPDYPICDECDERHSVDVSCEDYTERAMQKATASDSTTGPAFTDRELATVLHSLRILQEIRNNEFIGGCWDRETHHIPDPDSCDHFLDAHPLTNDEIDVLCERLNLAPESPADDEQQISISDEMDALQEAVIEWRRASDGDSGDAEHDAGQALAEAAQALIGKIVNEPPSCSIDTGDCGPCESCDNESCELHPSQPD
jgi:hypothetical protein